MNGNYAIAKKPELHGEQNIQIYPLTISERTENYIYNPIIHLKNLPHRHRIHQRFHQSRPCSSYLPTSSGHIGTSSRQSCPQRRSRRRPG